MQKNILSWMGLSSLVMVLSGCVVAAPAMFAGAAGTGTANVAGSTVTVPQQLTDIKIKGQISGIATTLKIANANIEATVFNGIVLLLGQVPTQQNKMDLAAQIAALSDVTIVYNQLTVGPNIAFGTYANDTWITSKVKANLLSEVDPLHFVVVTQNGVVYLLGQVTKQEGDDAAKLASQTSGVARVVKIFNYVTIAPAVPAATTAAPASAPTTAPAAAPSAAAPVTTSAQASGIPEYAPSYNAVDTQIGPAASD